MRGRIIKLISNQYTVLLENQQTVECIARGKLRQDKAPLAGDEVEVIQFEDKYGIEKIYPRKNYLLRPPIANVDQALIVMSACEPDFSTILVDQLLFLISHAGIKPLLLITKMDLVTDQKQIQDHIDDYRSGGYQVLCSGKDQDEKELNELATVLKGKITVLSGQSGVGKSSMINRLSPEFSLQTQEISKALGRGKHTTRHVELHPVAGGWVADTPGFSKLDFSHIKKEELMYDILDFQPYLNQCRFRDCLHDKEPGCAVKEAKEKGLISPVRYRHYIDCLRIIEQGKKNLYD